MKRGLTVVLVFLMLFSFFAISEVSATVYVSSKGGTTIAGLEQLRAGELEKTVENACKACTKRAYELSK